VLFFEALPAPSTDHSASCPPLFSPRPFLAPGFRFCYPANILPGEQYMAFLLWKYVFADLPFPLPWRLRSPAPIHCQKDHHPLTHPPGSPPAATFPLSLSKEKKSACLAFMFDRFADSSPNFSS